MTTEFEKRFGRVLGMASTRKPEKRYLIRDILNHPSLKDAALKRLQQQQFALDWNRIFGGACGKIA